MIRINLIAACISMLGSIVSAQTPQTLDRLLGDGIFIQGGFGYLALHDEYISKEKYSGSLYSFEAGWLKSHDSAAVRLDFIFRKSSAVRNNNVSAKVIQAGLRLDYLYPVGSFQLYSCDIFAFLGPSMELYSYDRTENIAGGYHSNANYFSLGVNSTLILPMGPAFSTECSGMLNLVGWGVRSTISQEKTKFVSVFSGIRGYANIFLRYSVENIILLKVGYKFEICQSSSWDYLLSASDNLIFVVAYQI